MKAKNKEPKHKRTKPMCGKTIKANAGKFLKYGEISILEYDRTCKYMCYCNSEYWCEKCDGNFDLFE